MHIVLVEPKIPQNTGSIARTCAATNTPLHIVGEIPFEISDKTVKRAGLDYWPFLNLTLHKDFEDFLNSVKPEKLWYLSKFASKNYFEATFSGNDALVFGSETTGLGQNFLNTCPQDSILKIPMANENVRSLNLSNAVSIVLYEAIRQVEF